jgi:hypothetical protein
LGNICGDPPTSGKICRVPAARGGSGGGRDLLHTVKVTNPATVAAMEGFTAARFPASSYENQQHLGSDVLFGKKVNNLALPSIPAFSRCRTKSGAI